MCGCNIPQLLTNLETHYHQQAVENTTIKVSPPHLDCPKCHQVVRANYIWCPTCGAALREHHCKYCQQKVQPQDISCKFCGAPA
jgi:predicted amidophosphoribosyltransferase